MLSPSRNSLAEQGIRSPVGRDIQSVPRSRQSTGRGGAGNAKSVKASKRHVSEVERRAILAAENEVVQQHKREKAASSSLVTGRGGMGNIRKSKQDKSKISPTLSQPCRPSTTQTRSSNISSFVLDISAEAFTSSFSELSGNPFHTRRYSFSDLSITEPRGTTLPSISLEGPETDHPWPIDDPPLTARTSYSIPESTFGALAEAHEGIASDHWTAISARCFADSPNSSRTKTGGSYYDRRLPSSVAPFEEPPMNFDLTPSSSQRSQHRAVSTNPPKERSSPPPTRRTPTSGTQFTSSLPFDKYYTPEHRPRAAPVIMLPPEQHEAPISPLSPPPRFNSPTSDSTPALSPHPPLSASSAPRVNYWTTHGFRENGGSRPSTSGSGYRPSIADHAIEMESAHSYKQREVALWRLKTPTKLISRISSQSGEPFIPLAAIANPPPRPARTGKAKVSSRIAGVNPPTRPIKIPDTPPQIPISIFVNPQPNSHSMGKPSPTSPLAPSFRSTPSDTQYESFTPTFGSTPLPALPAPSRRTTHTSLAPSEYTFASASTSPVSVMEESPISMMEESPISVMEAVEEETAEFAQLETG